MLVSEFHFDLPPELIAQQPPAQRGSSRMLRLDRASGEFKDGLFADLPSLLRPGDLLVLNDSRVLPARLFASRGGLRTQAKQPAPSGRVEVLLTLPAASSAPGQTDWHALVKPAKKCIVGEHLFFYAENASHPLLTAEIIGAGENGERTLRFHDDAATFHAAIECIGSLPLPPYIHRDAEAPNTPEDRERYQTVYSHERGSVAAPTAGLHFTPEILAQIESHKIEIARITLHVGLGTFQPVRVTDTRDIRLHAEPYTLSLETAEALNRAHCDGRRIVAVGTTSTRTLEHLARTFIAQHGPITQANPLALAPHSGSTSLFLSPPPDGDSTFHLVGGLLTNFHLPESTLLMLVSAFAGREHALAAYAHSVAERYRFFSYGDCMLIL